MKVLVTDKISPRGVEVLEGYEGLEVVVDHKISPEDLLRSIGGYDAIAIRSRTKMTKEVIEAGDRLKVISRAGVGLDNVDIEAATERGVVVMNTPGTSNVTTAEHTIAMLMALARKIPQANRSIKNGKWEKSKFTGVELSGKTLGVIGLGNIGSVVAGRAQGLGMKINGFDPFLSRESALKHGINRVSLDDLVAGSDFITVHTPMTDETRGLISDDAFEKMKDGVMVLNCARGGIIDEEALYRAIQSGKVAGAALDVFSKEPPTGNPIIELDEVICTPHLGASTTEAQANVAVAAVEQIADYLTKGNIRNAVNAPALSPEILEKLSPYLVLAEKLGSLYAQLFPGGVSRISFEYSGDILKTDPTPLSHAFLKGLFEPVLDLQVNMINAHSHAVRRGIEVVGTRSPGPQDFSNMMVVNVQSDDGDHQIAGVVMGKKTPRIVKLDSLEFEAPLEGNILVVRNKDRPGTIGAIGVYLGEKGVNIAGFQLGREEEGGSAIAFINIDSTVKSEMIEEIAQLSNVVDVHQVNL